MKYLLVVLVLISCTEDELKLAAVLTGSTSDITATSFKIEGEVKLDGGSIVTERGFVISKNPNPTIDDTKILSGAGVGKFWSEISSLNPNSAYHVRAFANNVVGQAYGEDITVTTIAILPTITTNEVTSIGVNTSVVSGNVVSDGGAQVQRGICWNTSPNPTILNSKTSEGTGVGSFTSILNGLSANTKYYAKAYASNSVGITYGSEVQFSTVGVVGIDGSGYKTVVINGKEWMAENLRVTKYKNGDAIPLVQNEMQWSTLSTGAYFICCGGNPSSNQQSFDEQYGKLYNGFSVNDSRGLCPSGWRVPTDSEWSQLRIFLGAEATWLSNEISGQKLKSTTGWDNKNGTNLVGFNALPSGYVLSTGSYVSFNGGASFSTSTIQGDSRYCYFLGGYDYTYRDLPSMKFGSSIRCIKE